MKRSLAAFALLLIVTGCSNKLSTQVLRPTNPIVPPAATGERVEIDLERSSVYWKGTALGGMSKHNGTVKLSSGYLMIQNDSITGGAFTMEMNTFEPIDIKSKAMKRKFIKHMRSDDFFNTQLYPTSSFTITKATKDSISGNFTLRDFTRNITFAYSYKPSVYMRELAFARIVINKDDWKVPYKRVNDLVEVRVGLVVKGN